MPHHLDRATYGQGLVVDLGPGGLLVALLTQKAFLVGNQRRDWVQDDPGGAILHERRHDRSQTVGWIDTVLEITQ